MVSETPSLRITFLGTGTSVGVPSIGCSCKVCRSVDAHDKRLRSSVLVETDSTRVLIDCGPDFRQQILPLPFKPLNGVLLTHHHYDHVVGIDDLRPFCVFAPVEIYASEGTIDILHQTIPYCFGEHLYPGAPQLHFNPIALHCPLRIGDMTITPLQVMHGRLPVLGFRIGHFAYLTDMKYMEETEMPYLENIDTLVVSALRFENPHHSHQLVDDAITFARKIGARRTYLTHVSHHIGLHREVNQRLPDGVELAYDGQIVEVLQGK
ncbi:MAG: MBL fold metallo-hydrolase [Prevotella sp.]|nr:MBL fold metallo-hydrolase [Prevotella sp.]